jgi:hypothetical protein
MLGWIRTAWMPAERFVGYSLSAAFRSLPDSLGLEAVEATKLSETPAAIRDEPEENEPDD